MIAFKHTLLPVPVRPAISKCAATPNRRRADYLRTSLPKKIGIFSFFTLPSDSSITSRSLTTWRCSLGTSMPTVFLPGMGATMRTLGDAKRDRQVVGQAGDLGQSQAGFELDFVLSDDGAGLDLDDLYLEAEIEKGLLQNLRLAAHFGRLRFEVDVFRR